MEFLIVDINAPYNAIMRKSCLGEIKAMASPFYHKLKFSSPEGVFEVRGSQEQARLCFYMAARGANQEVVKNQGKKSNQKVSAL